MPDHLGYEVWGTHEPGFPFPFSPINLRFVTDDAAEAAVDVTLPVNIPASPKGKVFSGTSIGINNKGELTFAIRCTQRPNGKIDIVGVMSTSHGHFWKSHGEKDVGDEHIWIIPDKQLRKGGRKEVFTPHGLHCDQHVIEWYLIKGGLRIVINYMHWPMTEKEFHEMRERTRRRARRRPRLEDLPIPLPIIPKDGEKPKPKKEKKGPVGKVLSDASGKLAGVLEDAAWWLRGI